MKSHKDLDVWRAAIDMAREIYELTRTYPKDEQYGMVSQMRRSAVSIASNIAEGAARQSKKEFIQFLYVAVGSANELDTQLEISKVVKMAETERLDAMGMFGPGRIVLRAAQTFSRGDRFLSGHR